VRAGEHAKAANGDAFDIRVLAFAQARSRTLRGLQEIFGVDASTAVRILESVPAVVRRGVGAEQAQSYVTALQSIGAEVVLERPAANPSAAEPRPVDPPVASAARRPPPPPGPLRPRAAPPAPPIPAFARGSSENNANAPLPLRSSDLPLPRPILRPPSSDLEFDMTGQQDDLGGSMPQASGPDELDYESGADASGRRGTRSGRREEIELDATDTSNRLDIDPAAAAATQRVDPSTRDQAALGADNDQAQSESRVQGARTMRIADATQRLADPQRGPAMSRAAVVQRPAEAAASGPRSLALLQLLAAVAVVVLGVWLDNTIIYGNATPFSVLVHGLALQQLGFSLWKLLR
jgi:hypothetical protein